VVSTTVPYGRILGFLDRSSYFLFLVAPQLYSRGWVDSVPDSLLLLIRKSSSPGNRTLTSGSDENKVNCSSHDLILEAPSKSNCDSRLVECKNIVPRISALEIYVAFSLSLSLYIYIYIHTHTHIHTHTCMCVCWMSGLLSEWTKYAHKKGLEKHTMMKYMIHIFDILLL
jgi:hypothetical protein